MTYSCYRIRGDKTFTTSVSCEAAQSSCCYLDRIFTLTTDTTDTASLPQCGADWDKCFSNAAAAAVKADSLSDIEKIWVIVCSVLVFLVLLLIVFFIYRLVRQRKQAELKNVGTDSGNMTVDIDAAPGPKAVEATQIFVTNAAMRTTTREREPVDLKDKIDKLIRSHDDEKLEALLETISDFYSEKVDQDSVNHAREVLDAWKAESVLQEFCNSQDQSSPEYLSKIQSVVQQAEDSQQDHIHPLIVRHAKQKLSSELDRQNMIQELKVKVNAAMTTKDLADLEKLVDIIRAKQLDKEFEKELWYAQNQFQEQADGGVGLVQRDLASAMGGRDVGHLRRAVQRVEDSGFRRDLASELNQAKQTIEELEDIMKMKNLHRLKIKNAIKSQDIPRMEDALRNAKLDGFGEDLKPEIEELELLLKRRYLQKRLKGNINVAVKFLQNLDLVRLRRAIEEVTTAGFILELGLELDEAQGLLSKLERIELIKKAVMELTNSHIAEIKSYTAPPIEVHKVLMALLIVLGEEPEVVRDWFEIQVILVKTGKMSLKRRVQEYNPGNLATGNARRAANILHDIKSEDLHSVSRAAKVFYLWTTAVVEDRLSLDIIQ